MKSSRDPEKKSRLSRALSSAKRVGANALNTLQEKKRNKKRKALEENAEEVTPTSTHKEETSTQNESFVSDRVFQKLMEVVEEHRKENGLATSGDQWSEDQWLETTTHPSPSETFSGEVSLPTSGDAFNIPPPSDLPPAYIKIEEKEKEEKVKEKEKEKTVSSTNELYTAIAKRRKQLKEAKRLDQSQNTVTQTNTTTTTSLSKKLNTADVVAKKPEEKIVSLEKEIIAKEKFKTVILEEIYEEPFKEEKKEPVVAPKKSVPTPTVRQQRAPQQKPASASKNRSCFWCCGDSSEEREKTELLENPNINSSKKSYGK